MKENFRFQQIKHQIDWRETNISTKEKGSYNGTDYDHIIPVNLWKENLWHGISDDLILSKYLIDNKIQAHAGKNNLVSSWILSANLYFPIRNNDSLKRLMLSFLQKNISSEIIEIIDIELEFAFPINHELNPAELLGEIGGSRGSGQTSPDVAFLVKTKNGDGIILTECKYTEHSFYGCSARRTNARGDKPGNPKPENCLVNAKSINFIDIPCHQHVWKRKYLNIIEISEFGKKILTRCPAATAGYQLLRQQALAEGIAKSGRFSLVASTVSFDARNSDLKGCLKSTGINDFQIEWAKLFNGKAIFKTWTHQEWVQFVRENQVNGEFDEWLKYLNERYGY